MLDPPVKRLALAPPVAIGNADIQECRVNWANRGVSPSFGREQR
jgi:hypothetical protein